MHMVNTQCVPVTPVIIEMAQDALKIEESIFKICRDIVGKPGHDHRCGNLAGIGPSTLRRWLHQRHCGRSWFVLCTIARTFLEGLHAESTIFRMERRDGHDFNRLHGEGLGQESQVTVT